MIKSGWVVKEGGRYKSWKKRWLVVEKDTLSYYKKENMKEKCGEINLRHASQIHKVDYKKFKHCFQIVTPDRTYHITCDSAEDLDSWCDILVTQQQLFLNPPKETTQAPTVQKPLGEVKPVVTNRNTDPTHGQHSREESRGHIVSLKDFDALRTLTCTDLSKVVLVRKKDSGTVYAMKVINKKCLANETNVEHTKAEQTKLMKLSHPFHANLHYIFQTSENLYLVMDYISGGPLSNHLTLQGRPALDRIKFYAAEIVVFLEFYNSLGMAFRDLKLSNILLARDGHLSITNSYLQKYPLARDVSKTVLFQSPEYLAPEVLEDKIYNTSADWWSFGIVLYKMFVGKSPFYSDDVAEMQRKILTAELKVPTEIPTNAANLIKKLLIREPEKRLTKIEVIKNHMFFVNIDWKKMDSKDIEAPLIPGMHSDSNSKSTLEACIECKDSSNNIDYASGFEGFTYVSINDV